MDIDRCDAMAKAIDVAKFIISCQKVSPGELQKLLFQAQGLYFAKYGEALFPDKIEVARDGPVVRNVIDHLKEGEQSHLTLEEKETVLEMLKEESTG